MGIFKDYFSTGNNPGKPPQQQPQQLHRFTYVLQKHFRGYKRFHITIYGDKEAERNNEKLSGDLAGKSLTFVETISNSFTEPKHYYIVYLDDMRVGAIYNEEQVYYLSNLLITAVYAKVEEELDFENKKEITRKRIRLFVKYSEQ